MNLHVNIWFVLSADVGVLRRVRSRVELVTSSRRRSRAHHRLGTAHALRRGWRNDATFNVVVDLDEGHATLFDALTGNSGEGRSERRVSSVL